MQSLLQHRCRVFQMVGFSPWNSQSAETYRQSKYTHAHIFYWAYMRTLETYKWLHPQRGFEECSSFFKSHVKIGPPMDQEADVSYSSDRGSMIERQKWLLDAETRPHALISHPKVQVENALRKSGNNSFQKFQLLLWEAGFFLWSAKY